MNAWTRITNLPFQLDMKQWLGQYTWGMKSCLPSLMLLALSTCRKLFSVHFCHSTMWDEIYSIRQQHYLHKHSSIVQELECSELVVLGSYFSPTSDQKLCTQHSHYQCHGITKTPWQVFADSSDIYGRIIVLWTTARSIGCPIIVNEESSTIDW